MKTGLRIRFVLGALGIALVVAGCREDGPTLLTPENAPSGGVSVSLSGSEDSPFGTVAHRAVLAVSAPDMVTVTACLSVKENSVEGTVWGIPAGDDRLFEITVYDADDNARYYGNAKGSVLTDELVDVAIHLRRETGGANITGRINEGAAELQPSKDTHVRGDQLSRANDNYGFDPFVNVCASRGGSGMPRGKAGAGLTLLEFDLGNCARPVRQAILKLEVSVLTQHTCAEPMTLGVYKVIRSGDRTPWIEGNGTGIPGGPSDAVTVDRASGVAWIGEGDGGDANNQTRPDIGRKQYASVTIGESGDVSIGDRVEWDITELVNEWIAGDVENLGLALKNEVDGCVFKEVHFFAREAHRYPYAEDIPPGNGPRLCLEH